MLLEELPSPPEANTDWPWTEENEPLPGTQSDGTPWPKISVVTPSYNQGRFIEETIRSVLLQRYPNLEYVVMDGGSTDETIEILEKYDPWIDNWVSEPDEGQSDAVNKGFDRASGDIYAWLNSDDYYAPDALATMARALSSCGKDVGAMVGEGHKLNEDGEIVYTPSGSNLTREAFLNWMSGGNFMQPACFFRREAWKQAGPLRTDLEYPMDVDLWLKMIRDYRFERVDETIAYAYIHDDAKTTGERQRMRAETILLIAEHGEWDVARQEIFRQADDLAEARRKVRRITRHPLYPVIRPLYKWLTS